MREKEDISAQSIKPVLVVVPAFNEEATVADVVMKILNLGFDVLVVDDGSTDETANSALVAGAAVLSLPINVGVGGALRAAFRFAIRRGYEAVIQIDADDQHPVHQIPELVSAAARSDADLVIGSRYLSTNSTLISSLPRQSAMRMLSALLSRAAKSKLTDSTSGFRLIRNPLLAEFALEFPNYYLGDTFEATVRAARAGYRIVEVPASLSPRLHGKSSAGTLQALQLIAKALLITQLRIYPGLHRSPRKSQGSGLPGKSLSVDSITK